MSTLLHRIGRNIITGFVALAVALVAVVPMAGCRNTSEANVASDPYYQDDLSQFAFQLRPRSGRKDPFAASQRSQYISQSLGGDR